MTAGVSGYRTLAQLGAALPAPADDASPPPPPLTALPHWTPIVAPPRADGPAAPRGDATGDARRAVESGWTVPFTPLTLPAPSRALREGASQLWQFHPNDPLLRLTGRHVVGSEPIDPTATPTDPIMDHAARTPDASTPGSDSSERSGIAKGAMMVGIGGGLAMNAIDIGRLVKKYPEALRAGRFDPTLGRSGRLPTALGLTALTRPDSRIIDPSAPPVASMLSKGRSFTRFDAVAMKASVLLGASLAGIQLASAIPNLHDAVTKDGAWHEDLARSTSGRAGMLQLAGGTMGVALFATALRQTRGQAGAGVVERIMAASTAPIMARPLFGKIATATAMLVMSNELGYLDVLNRGERRSTPTVLVDGARRTPVVNDSEFRTAGILGAGGIVGFKAHRAFRVAGSSAGIGTGLLVGGAAVAGLLGAQLLGGLSKLDKPGDTTASGRG